MDTNFRIVLLEDEEKVRKDSVEQLEKLGQHSLNKRFGYLIAVQAVDRTSKLPPILADKQGIDLALLDQQIEDSTNPDRPLLPDDEQGEAAVKLLHKHRPQVKRIVVVTQQNVTRPELPRLAMGADEYWFKGDLGGVGLVQQVARILDLPSQYSLEHLKDALEKAEWLKERKWRLREVQSYLDGKLVGSSIEILKVKFQICEAALSGVPVLITGESGCGKEEVAKAIHRLSARGNEEGRLRPYSLNCAEFLNENMLQSELFGHTKGAFTGADKQKTGLLFLANSSTLFLDEVGLATKSFQHFLLRALEEKQARPLGEGKKLPFDVRIIAATDRSVFARDSGEFFSRALLHRLCGIHIEIPPLYARPLDIRPLVEHYKRGGGDVKKAVAEVAITEMANRFLETYPWPGNVRQLKTALEVLFMRCELTGQKILSQYDFEMYLPRAEHDIAERTRGGKDFCRYQATDATLKDVEARFSADFVYHEHERLTGGEKSDLAYERTAEELGASVSTIKSRLRDYREFFEAEGLDDV